MPEIKRGKKLKNSAQPCQADLADKFVCYQHSVQEPDHEVRVFDQVYREAYKTKPMTLREISVAPLRCHANGLSQTRIARRLGLISALKRLHGGLRTTSKLKAKVAERVEVLEQDVRSRTVPQVDVLAAQNFSFWCASRLRQRF